MNNIIELRKNSDRSTNLNVLGRPLDECSCHPMTGWFRDGSCRTDENDIGHHVICCVMTENFLAFSKLRGNDLSKGRPEFGFPGLKPGDHWCLCAQRWLEALKYHCAPKVVLNSCHLSALEVISLDDLKAHAYTKRNRFQPHSSDNHLPEPEPLQ